MLYFLWIANERRSMEGLQLAQLRYLVEIEENGGNMTRAAKSLFISQPALSKSIHDLETELGIRLFTRDSQRMKLTADGQYVFEQARFVLQKIDEISSHFGKEKYQTLTLGTHASLMAFMPPFLSDFSKQNPEIRVFLNGGFIHRKDLIQAIQNDLLDMAMIVYNPAKNPLDASEINYSILEETKTV